MLKRATFASMLIFLFSLSPISFGYNLDAAIQALYHSPQNAAPVYNGAVSWFDKQRGFGEIQPDDGSKVVFVHFSVIQSPKKEKTLHSGQRVTFAVLDDGKTRRALWVRPL